MDKPKVDKRTKAYRDSVGRRKKEPGCGNRRAPRGKTVGAILSDEQIAILIDKYYGIYTDMAKAAGVTYQCIFKRIDNSPYLQQECVKARSKIIVAAESKLLEIMEAGDIKAVMFILKSLGKHKGWSEDVNLNVRVQVGPEEAKAAVATLFGLKTDEPTVEDPESKEDEEV